MALRAGSILSLALPISLSIAACSSTQNPDAGDAAGMDIVRVDGTAMDGPASDNPSGVDTPGVDIPPFDSGVATIPSGHPRIYLNAAQLTRLRSLLMANNPAATRFRMMVDSQLGGGNVYAFEAWYAALMFQLTGETRYADFAIAQVDRWVTSEEALISARMRAQVAGDSYLEVGGYIGDLALTYDWCFDRLTPAQRTRWLRYANQAVSNVWNHETASWGGQAYPWSGWSVDNPSNNYYYSFLRATLLLGLAEHTEDPQSALWISTFRERKIRDQLFPTFNRDLQGGGSREGTGYGVAMASLFRLMDLWEQSTTERLADFTPHARQSMLWMMHNIVPTLDRISPVGDHARDSTGALFDYHRDYLQTLTALYPADPLAGYARQLVDSSSVPRMGQGFMYYSDFLYANPAVMPRALDGLHTAYHAPGTGHVIVRSGWQRDAVWAHFLSGPYTESHAHQDQGSFLIYRNEWLAYDQNINSRSGIQQGVRMHNLVRVDEGANSVSQRESASPANLVAMADQPRYFYVASDISPVYEGRAAVQHVDREMVYLRDQAFVVMDRVRSNAGAQRVFQLNAPVMPTVSNRTVTVRGMTSNLTLYSILPASAPIRVVDWRMEDSDMNGGYRVDISDGSGTESVFLTVLGVDGAVMAATGADEGTNRGVRITLRDGSTATVRFNGSAIGGTINWVGSDGMVRANEALPTGVATLPVERR